ncbi:hypothetical protein BaRGS_00019023, partial [Batillaria attramentaria]
IKFVQFQKNSAHHSGIKCSPYSAMFGCEARVGLTSSSLPQEVVSRLESEDDLQAVVQTHATPASTSTATVTDVQATIEVASDNTSDSPSSNVVELQEDMSDSQEPVGSLAVSEESLDAHTTHIKRRRANAYAAQMSQAERMVKRSRVDLKAGEPGDNVAIPIPSVDRGRGDPRNILGIIVNRDLDTDLYRIAVKAGVLSGQYSRNQFDLCPQRLLSEQDVDQEKTVSLRSAVRVQSASGGQGFTKCNCNGVKKCQTNRLKAKLNCNSRCHGSLTCANK